MTFDPIERRVTGRTGLEVTRLSGILVDPSPTSQFDTIPASPDVVERARRLAEACARNGIELRAAAIQFPLAHPAGSWLVAGVRSIEHLDEYSRAMAI